jgi:phosphoserine phosphatase
MHRSPTIASIAGDRASIVAGTGRRNVRASGRMRTRAEIQRTPTQSTLSVLSELDGICFDVDSTFCKDESIDELADFLGVGEVVKSLTAQAMGGNVLFQDALATRLNAMNPSKRDVEKFLREHPHVLSDGIPELLDVLARRGVKVFLVSGGFRQIIEPLADSLGIPVSHVFANNLLFDDENGGSYAGFDPEEFTSRSGGKREAVVHIKEAFGLNSIAMVGDGATDAEAKDSDGAKLFIGYGGTVFRENVAERADWYVMEIAENLQCLSGPVMNNTVR